MTSTKANDYWNFSYKEMDESMCPYSFDCPVGILNLLTPTDSENANEWRRLCREQKEKKKEKKMDKKNPSNLPVGTIISFDYYGRKVTIQKMNPAYQFKRPWWYNAENHSYFTAKRIPNEFEIIELGEENH